MTKIKQILQMQSKRDNPNSYRVYDVSGISPTLTVPGGGGRQPHISDGRNEMGLRIRKLTPRECMRLQGVEDEVIDKLISAGISDGQLYKAAGDAVTVNVVFAVAKAIREQTEPKENVNFDDILGG